LSCDLSIQGSSMYIHGSSNWLHKDRPLTGFAWAGGADRVTTGIDLWSEPFVCELPSGELVSSKVASVFHSSPSTGRFQSGRTRGNAVLIVKVLKMHRVQHWEPFSGQKFTSVAGFCIGLYNLKIFRGWYPGPRCAPVLEPRHRFPLALPAFSLFLFYETSIGSNINVNVNVNVISYSALSHSVASSLVWRDSHGRGQKFWCGSIKYWFKLEINSDYRKLTISAMCR